MTRGNEMIDYRRADGLVWRKSTRTQQNNQCVEVAEDGPSILVRDSKNLGGGPFLLFTRPQWEVFLREVVYRLPSNNLAVEVTTGDMLRRYRERGDVLTRWHIRSLDTDEVLHFDEDEWAAFRDGVMLGEFGPLAPPTPALAAS
jgi:Domain of unknown function (DUF397)